jgi:hypothetical protein
MKKSAKPTYSEERKRLLDAIVDASHVVAIKREELRVAENVLNAAEFQLRAFEQR